MTISLFDIVENIVGEKKRKCWLPAFSSFPTVFAKALISLFDSVEITVEKGENAVYQNFLPFPQ